MMNRGGVYASIRIRASWARWLCTKPVEVWDGREQRLYRRLSALGATGGSAGMVLDQYRREEGGIIGKPALDRCINELRKYGRNKQALEVMEWMKTSGAKFEYYHFAVRLDLEARTWGISKAEKYFMELPPGMRNPCAYASLLDSYCRVEMVEEALSLFEKMEELNFASPAKSFNCLMLMFTKINQPEKVLLLIEKMKQRSIRPCNFTYCLVMSSYSSLNDMEGVERTFKEMTETIPDCKWTAYSNLAAIYVKAGVHEKAEWALRKLEEKMEPNKRMAYHFLISLYAGINKATEVHRIWALMKSVFPVMNNSSYIFMIRAMRRLGEVCEVNRFFKEWSSCRKKYDMKVVNSVIFTYLKYDMLEEAKALLLDSKERSMGPLFGSLQNFMHFYLRKGEIDAAFECLEEAGRLNLRDEWRLSDKLIEKFSKFFEERKDVDNAERFCGPLKKMNCSDCRADKLLDRFNADCRARMDKDGIDVDSELEDVLEICPSNNSILS